MRKLLLSIGAGFILAAMAWAGPPARKGLGEGITIAGQVTLIHQAQVSASESGIMAQLEARPGMIVEEGQELGKLDDERPQIEKRMAEYDLDIARKHSEDDVNVRYSRAAWEVAKSEMNQGLEANSRVPGSVTQGEMRRRALTADRAKLEIEKAERELAVAKVATHSKEATLEMAKVNVNRRLILAPIAGVVVEVHRNRGEWIKPGDPVLRIVAIDRLRVEGFLKADQHGSEIAGRPVTVTALLPGGRSEQFQGKVVFVSPEVEPVSGEFRIYAEVVNRDQLLRPGLTATLTIHP